MKHLNLRFLPFLLLGGTLGLTAAPAAFEVIGVKASATGDLYLLVTDANSIKAGDVILFVYHNDTVTKANGALNQAKGAYLNVYDAYFEDEFLYFNNSSIKPLTVGGSKGAFTFTYDSTTIAVNNSKTNNLCKSTESSAVSTWAISIDSTSKAATISSTNSSYGFIQYNSSGSGRFSNYQNTMTNGQIYRKSAQAKEIELNKTSVQQNVGSEVTLVATGKNGYTPSSYEWSITEGSSFVSIKSQSTNTAVISLNSKGSAVVKCVADGKAEATCSVTVSDYEYNILTKDKYYITEGSGLAMLGADLSYISDVDFGDTTNLWTLEKAYQGDNSYYVSNGTKYLSFNRDIPGHESDSKESRIALSDEPINVWTVSTKDTNYVFSTVTKKSGTRSLATHEETWYAFEGTSNYVKFLESGEFDHYAVTKQPTKTKYYVEEKFNPLNMKVMAYYTNGFESDITSKIVWDDLVAGHQATGKVLIGGNEENITVTGLNIFGPKAGTLTVEGIKDSYLIGEMPSRSFGNVSVTYSDGDNNETKVLTKDEYKVVPEKVNSSTDKIIVSMVNAPEVKLEQSITSEHAQYFATNMFEIGDKVTLGTVVGANNGNITGGNEIAIVDGQVKSKQFGYLPSPELEFTVIQGINSGTYAFECNGSYLTSNGKTLDFGKVSTITGAHEDDGTWTFSYPYMLSGQSEPLYIDFYETAKESGDFNGYVYSYEKNVQIQGEAIMADEDTMMFSLDIYQPISTMEPKHEEFELKYEINGQLVIYLPSEQTISAKNSFTCTYVESQNDWVDDYWEICPVNEPLKHVYFNTDSEKFGVDELGDYNVMLFRDMTKDFSHKIKSLSVSIPEDMPNTVEINGTYNWVGIIVKATYDNTTKKLPLGAYEVDIPTLDSYGEHACTVTYGTSGNKVQGTFKIYVVGKTGGVHIKQNTYEVWVDDTNTFTTVEDIPAEEPVTWSSSDPTLANFEDPSVGALTSYKSGKVTITVTSFDGYYKDSKELTVSQRPTSLTLDVTEKTIKQGEKFTITGTVMPLDAKNKTVLWSSSDADIATINSKGEVTGLGVGTVVITGQTQGKGTGESEGYKATCTVTVEQGEVVRVTGVSLSSSEKEIAVGASATLTAIVTPSDATEKSVTWASKYPDIVSVDKNGKVTGKRKGTSDVTVTTLDGGFTATCRVTVKENVEPTPVQSITLDITSKQINAGDEFILTATINPIDADDKQINWTTSNGSVATVEYFAAGQAKVVGISDGTATIKATCGGKSASCKVTVGDQPDPTIHVESVTIKAEKESIYIGDTLALEVVINPTNATNKKVTWSTSDEKTATIDANGKVTGIGEGKVTITVETVDGAKTASIKFEIIDKVAQQKTNTIIIASVGGTVAAVGVGCGIGIPLGIRAKKIKKLKIK